MMESIFSVVIHVLVIHLLNYWGNMSSNSASRFKFALNNSLFNAFKHIYIGRFKSQFLV